MRINIIWNRNKDAKKLFDLNTEKVKQSIKECFKLNKDPIGIGDKIKFKAKLSQEIELEVTEITGDCLNLKCIL